MLPEKERVTFLLLDQSDGKTKKNTTPVSNSDSSILTGTGTCSAADDDTSECTMDHVYSALMK